MQRTATASRNFFIVSTSLDMFAKLKLFSIFLEPAHSVKRAIPSIHPTTPEDFQFTEVETHLFIKPDSSPPGYGASVQECSGP
jgi:hypothetical protein